MSAYAELCCVSNFSFLRGGSHAEELVMQAKHLGLSAMAITDHNSLAGVVRAHGVAKETGLRFVVGVRLTLVPSSALRAPSPAQKAGEGARQGG
jgi:error-prone DNA polymerase